MTRQNGTKSDSSEPRELAPEQEVAILALLEGCTDAEAGERAGVARSTIARWKASDALFVARLGAARKAMWDAHIDGLRTLLREARGVVASAMKSQDEKVALSAALSMLKFADVHEELIPVDPTTERAVKSKWASDSVFENMFG